MFKTVFAALLMVLVSAILWTWFRTIPACLSSGWATPGYWGSSHYPSDNDGVFGCWIARVNSEKVREQAFEEWVREEQRQNRERHIRERWR
jgi:hypothetical protein